MENNDILTKKPLIITFEGIDASGKSTQVERLRKFLAKKKIDVVVSHEPTHQGAGLVVRNILQQYKDNPNSMNDTVVALLMLADRIQHVEEILKMPNTIILVDRFIMSTIAYQAYGAGVSYGAIRQISKYIANMIQDRVLNVVMDIPVNLAMERLKKRNSTTDAMEQKGAIFMTKVREGYLQEASDKTWGQSMVVNGDNAIKDISDYINNIVLEFIGVNK